MYAFKTLDARDASQPSAETAQAVGQSSPRLIAYRLPRQLVPPARLRA